MIRSETNKNGQLSVPESLALTCGEAQESQAQ